MTWRIVTVTSIHSVESSDLTMTVFVNLIALFNQNTGSILSLHILSYSSFDRIKHKHINTYKHSTLLYRARIIVP